MCSLETLKESRGNLIVLGSVHSAASHPFPVQPAGKPVSYGQNVGRPHKRWVITSCPLSPSVLFSNPLHRHRASPLFTDARWSPGQDLRPPLRLPPPPEMKSVHRGIQDSSKINPPPKKIISEVMDRLRNENCLLNPERTQPRGTSRIPAGVGGKCQTARL